jgi:hypothetical protein
MLLRARLHFICWRVPKTLGTSELLEVTHCHALLGGSGATGVCKDKCMSRNVEGKKCRGPESNLTAAASTFGST